MGFKLLIKHAFVHSIGHSSMEKCLSYFNLVDKSLLSVHLGGYRRMQRLL